MSWDKIENHLFEKYCVEGEDKELCKLMEEHDKEIREQAIEEFSEKFIYKAVCSGCSGCTGCYEEERQCECEEWKSYMEIAEQMKEVGE